jgi:hypothetical protein
MTPPPTNIDGTDITGATIDGQDVQEITVDGQTVFTGIDPNTIDNFEAPLYGDQNKTLSDYYNGDLNVFNRQQSTVQEGSFALEMTGSGTIVGSRKDITQGDTVRGFIRVNNNNGNPALMFGGNSDKINCYLVLFANLQNGDMNIDIFQNGNRTKRFTTNVSLSNNQWYEWELDWDTNNTITAKTFELDGTLKGTVTATDSTYTTGTGYGFTSDPDTPSYFDGLRFI